MTGIRERRRTLTSERATDLMRAYDSYISSCSLIRMNDVWQAIVRYPARRFYVSATRAALVISAMQRGEELPFLRPTKREMFTEIMNRAMALRERHPDWSLTKACRKVVCQPAPQFFLSPGSAKFIVCKTRKKWLEQKRKRLRLFHSLPL